MERDEHGGTHHRSFSGSVLADGVVLAVVYIAVGLTVNNWALTDAGIVTAGLTFLLGGATAAWLVMLDV